jgi:UDP-glucose 4-epimerase
MPIDENERIIPGSPYGESKSVSWSGCSTGWTARGNALCLSALLQRFGRVGRARRTSRPGAHIIPLVLQVALGQRADFAIFGDDYPTPDGTCVRDYIHVVDLAQAHILALRALDEGSRTYNLGNGRGFSVKEVIDRWHARSPATRSRHARRGAAPRRPGRARRQQREDSPRAGLGAEIPGTAYDYGNGVELARVAPARVRKVNGRARGEKTSH